MKNRKDSLGSFNTVHENLIEFNKLNLNEQNERIRDILGDAYGGRNRIKSATLLKIINLAKENESKTLHLENSVTVENNRTELIFSFSRIKALPAIIFYVGLLILLSSAATFAYLGEMKRANLNIDINNDGIADLNIDTDGDEVADVNIDTNNDKLPEENIDYMDNWTATFNIVKKDGTIKNKINQDTNKDGKCDLNCDINNDGWPELNLDLNGDGIADMFLDKDSEGYASMNIDTDGDKVCDVQCDTDLDGKCDKYCVSPDTIKDMDLGNISGGNNSNVVGSNIPTVTVEGQKVECNDLYPTDQPQEGALKECKTKLVVSNLSSLVIKYKLYFNINNNTYTSNNFKYRIIGNNGASSKVNYTTVPKSGSNLVFDIVSIKAATVQTYDISFILEGTNTDQNYDTNKSFNGEFKIQMAK